MVYHRYPKLAIVCKTFDQFIIAFDTYRGHKPDVDEFKDLMEQTKRRVGLRVLVADAGYVSESNREFARQVIGARTIIPAKYGRPTDKLARGKYCRLMQTRFDKQLMGNELKWKPPSPCSNVVKAITSGANLTGHHPATSDSWFSPTTS